MGEGLRKVGVVYGKTKSSSALRTFSFNKEALVVCRKVVWRVGKDLRELLCNVIRGSFRKLSGRDKS